MARPRKGSIDADEFFEQVAEGTKDMKNVHMRAEQDPNVEWNRDEFYELAMHPDFPDEMSFQLDRPVKTNPTLTFSQEGVDQLAEQFRTFVMARIVGRSEKVSPPHHMRVNVTFDWAPGNPRTDENVGPFWIAEDESLEPLDGTRRKYKGLDQPRRPKGAS